MSRHLSSLITATTEWLVHAYPSRGGAFGATMAAMQAHQAVTVAAWLRYPTAVDAALVELAGSGGSAGLDAPAGADPGRGGAAEPWRSWVDEVVASWAACLLGDGQLAASAVAALDTCEHAAGLTYEFRRLTHPTPQDHRAAGLLRHPQLLEPVAARHRPALHARLGVAVQPA